MNFRVLCCVLFVGCVPKPAPTPPQTQMACAVRLATERGFVAYYGSQAYHRDADMLYILVQQNKLVVRVEGTRPTSSATAETQQDAVDIRLACR